MLTLVKLSKLMNESKQQVQNQHLTYLQPKEEKFKMLLLFLLSVELLLTKMLILKKKSTLFKKKLDLFTKLIANLNFHYTFFS